MKDKESVAKLIRFSLAELTARNEQHTFEHLCRHLSRETICSNILPATGPVSAGGDQGRDFETFRTYLSTALKATTGFVGLASARPIAFACSLEKKVGSKVKEDVAAILGGTVRPEAIYFFSTQAVDVAKRHKLQTWAANTYGTHLEILDLHAIGELLAETRLAWVSVRFLAIPLEEFPLPATAEPDWYVTTKAQWPPERPPETYADLAEISFAGRHSNTADAYAQDRLHWLGLLRTLATTGTTGELRRKSLYELIVITLRGLGHLLDNARDVTDYIASLPDPPSSSDLHDLAVVIDYATGAQARELLTLEPDLLRSWRALLIEKVDTALSAAVTASTRCRLLDTRAHLALHDSITAGRPPDQTMEIWGRLLAEVDDAPLFPLESFAKRLNGWAFLLGDHTQYRPLTRLTDSKLSTRLGAQAAAESALDRAMSFYERDLLLRAIEELHLVKVRWFTEETIEGSILAALFLSECYERLRLFFAAKYFSVAAAAAASTVQDPALRNLIPEGLIRSAAAAYGAGIWWDCLALTEAALIARSVCGDRSEGRRYDVVAKAVWIAIQTRVLSERLATSSTDLIRARTGKWGIDDYFAELEPTARKTLFGLSDSELADRFAEQGVGPPFSDLSANLRIYFKALGLTFKVAWKNEQKSRQLAEEVLAILQVLLADLADVDFILLPTQLDLTIEVGPAGSELDLREELHESGVRYRIVGDTLPPDADLSVIQRQHAGVMAIALQLLRGVSLLRSSEFDSRVEERFNEGLPLKTFFGLGFGAALSLLAMPRVEEQWPRAVCSSRQAIWAPQPPQELAWRDSRLLEDEECKELVRSRYSHIARSIPRTLDRLRRAQKLVPLLETFRQKHWLDWHTLMALYSAVVNYRIRQEGIGDDPEAFQRRYRELAMMESVDSSAEIPSDAIAEPALIAYQRINLVAVARRHQLELHLAMPDLVALERLLSVRYDYAIDVPHAELLPET